MFYLPVIPTTDLMRPYSPLIIQKVAQSEKSGAIGRETLTIAILCLCKGYVIFCK